MAEKAQLVFKKTEPMKLSLAEEENATLVFSGIINGEGVPYEGNYTVLPSLYEAVELPTRGRVAKSDITVLKIPQYEVSNEAGGITFIIGENEELT